MTCWWLYLAPVLPVVIWAFLEWTSHRKTKEQDRNWKLEYDREVEIMRLQKEAHESHNRFLASMMEAKARRDRAMQNRANLQARRIKNNRG